MKRIIFLLFISLFAVSLYADDYETCVDNALRNKQYDAGIQCLRQAEQNSPKSYRIAYLFGEVFLAAGKNDSALVHFQRAIELKDDYVEAFQGMGKTYFDQKKYVKAIESFNNAMKNEGRNPSFTTVFDLGLSYAMADSFKQGTLYLSKAVELDKSNIDAPISLGDLYFKGSIYILAKEEYEAALHIDPKNVSVHEKLAQTFYKNAETDSAIAEYQTILSLDPTQTVALQNLASIYIQTNKWHDARLVYDKLVQKDPTNFDNLWNEAITAFKAQEFSNAIPPLKKIIAERKDTFGIKATQLLGQTYVYSKDYPSAVDLYKNFVQNDSAAVTSEDWKYYGSALLSNKDTTGALNVFAQYTLRDTSDCQFPKILGPERMRQRNYADAINYFKLRLSRCKDTTLATLKNIGLCYHVLSQFDSALIWYNAVLAKQPSDAYTLLEVGRIYQQQEQRDSALTAYQNYIANAGNDKTAGKDFLDKGFQEAYKNIGVIYLIKKQYNPAIDNLKKALEYDKDDCDALLWLAQSYHNLQQKDDACKYYKEVIAHNCKNAKDAREGMKLLDCK